MTNRFEELEKEVESLGHQGTLLFGAMANVVGSLGEESQKRVKEGKIKLPDFDTEYEIWYTECLRVIKQIIPERLEDFVKQYKNEKRKNITHETYSISDYLIHLRRTHGPFDHVIVDRKSALLKMQLQVSILLSSKKRFSSSLFDIKEVLRADLFDSELDSATELCKKGFTRGSGAIAGVVLENHLFNVSVQHNLKPRKNATISYLNDLLKDTVIDVPKWRFIQLLGDLRNLCDHKKKREPTQEEITKLIEGVNEVIKTVF